MQTISTGTYWIQKLRRLPISEQSRFKALPHGVGLSSGGFGVAAADFPIGPFTYIGRVRYPESEKPLGWKDCYDGIEDGDMACYLTDAKGKTKKNSKSPYIALKEFEGGELDIHFGKEMPQVVTNVTSSSVVGFKYFDFEQEPYTNGTITLTVNAIYSGTVERCVDEPDSKHCAAKVQIDGKNRWESYTASLTHFDV